MQIDELSILPVDVRAEQSVVGAILLDPAILDEVRMFLPTPDAFFDDAMRAIYGAMLVLADAGKSIETVILADAVRKVLLENENVPDLLARLADNAITSAFVTVT